MKRFFDNLLTKIVSPKYYLGYGVKIIIIDNDSYYYHSLINNLPRVGIIITSDMQQSIDSYKSALKQSFAKICIIPVIIKKLNNEYKVYAFVDDGDNVNLIRRLPNDITFLMPGSEERNLIINNEYKISYSIIGYNNN